MKNKNKQIKQQRKTTVSVYDGCLEQLNELLKHFSEEDFHTVLRWNRSAILRFAVETLHAKVFGTPVIK